MSAWGLIESNRIESVIGSIFSSALSSFLASWALRLMSLRCSVSQLKVKSDAPLFVKKTSQRVYIISFLFYLCTNPVSSMVKAMDVQTHFSSSVFQTDGGTYIDYAERGQFKVLIIIFRKFITIHHKI